MQCPTTARLLGGSSWQHRHGGQGPWVPPGDTKRPKRTHGVANHGQDWPATLAKYRTQIPPPALLQVVDGLWPLRSGSAGCHHKPTDEPLEQGRNRSRRNQRSAPPLPICWVVQGGNTRAVEGPRGFPGGAYAWKAPPYLTSKLTMRVGRCLEADRSWQFALFQNTCCVQHQGGM